MDQETLSECTATTKETNIQVIQTSRQVQDTLRILQELLLQQPAPLQCLGAHRVLAVARAMGTGMVTSTDMDTGMDTGMDMGMSRVLAVARAMDKGINTGMDTRSTSISLVTNMPIVTRKGKIVTSPPAAPAAATLIRCRRLVTSSSHEIPGFKCNFKCYGFLTRIRI
ncbi:hypothetical protein D4764_01G0001670 [Takifugu flavidus]|uniref:Uncharacterized protein n=1 Tax=Takifugu flavidus TaxID=433684 RepID=A0A5C6PKF0_9TELE|nr:hypothetical protein D4764_01G0001670 [Takifugu flavidus]